MNKKRLWCYLNINNPIVAWEVAMGRISSVDSSVYLTEESRRSFLSMWQYSRMKVAHDLDNWNPFKKEMRMEYIRHKEFNNSISRMRGCYFFESKDMAIDVVKSFKWSGAGFREDLLTEIEFFYSDGDMSLYDSAWIQADMVDEDIRSYLSGETKYEAPATEVLCYGRGLVLNEELVTKARELTVKNFPKSKLILESAIIIFERIFKPSLDKGDEVLWDAYHVAQVSPFFKKFDDENSEIIFLLSDAAFKKYGLIKTKDPVELPNLKNQMFKVPIKDFIAAHPSFEI